MTTVTPRPIETGTEKMLAHVEGRIGWMTYNNPARLNAMSYDMQVAVPRILGAFAADPEVHVIVVRGAGSAPSCPAPTSPSSPRSARPSPPASTTTTRLLPHGRRGARSTSRSSQ